MYRILFLIIIACLAAFCHYVSYPRLSEYPSIITSLDTISKRVNVRNINYGGCAYFAYYLTDLLDSAGIRYEIGVLNLSTTPDHITHVLVYLPEYNLFLDSIGVYNGIMIGKSRFFYCFLINTFYDKKKLRHVLSTYNWNRSFNLRDTITLKRLLKV